MANDTSSPNVTDASRPARRIGGSPLGLAVSTVFFLLGAANYYLIPYTGGLTTVYWNPILYDFFLNRFFLVFVYIPLIQLPMATIYFIRSHHPPGRWQRTLSRPVVFGIFGLVAISRGMLWVATTVDPSDAGSVQWLVDYVLWGSVVGDVGIPTIVGTLYLFYFPAMVLAVLLADRYPGRPRKAATADDGPPAGGAPGTDSPAGSGHGVVGAAGSVSVPRSDVRIPYWGVVGGVGVLLVGGFALGGLESAIGIAGLLVSLYELQPEGAS